MAARVLFFGATADIAGTRTVEVTIVENFRLDSLLADIVKRFPGLGSHSIHVSINQRYAAGDEIICDGDELAIFTAVSGG